MPTPRPAATSPARPPRTCSRSSPASAIRASRPATDFFGELVADPATAERATADYVQLAKTLAQVEDVWLAIDLSHIGLDASVDACRRHLATIVEALPAGRRIQVGAEDTSRTDPILEVVTALAAEGRR